MKTKVEFLKDRLIDLFSREEPFVITLDGDWGVGKTHFWNNFKEEHLKEKKVSYVSLFGKDSIQDIRTDIILQISKKDELINKSKSFLSKIGNIVGVNGEDMKFTLSGSILSSLLTLFSKKDFENVVVCLDDFERLSKNLEENDVLGLISELKEQKNCKVVMILNQDKVEDETLSKYKDKIIDYELHYLPTPKESYSLVKDNLKCFKQYPLNYFQKHNINNIRVMRRVINSLNDFDFVGKLVKENTTLEKEIVDNIIELSTINSITHFKDFNKLKEYTLTKSTKKSSSYGNNDFKENEEYENVLSYIDTGHLSYFYPSDITHYMIDYVNTSIINKEPLLTIIEERKSIQNRDSVYKEISRLYDMFNFNLTYKVDDFVNELFKVFEENSSNIVDIVNSNNFIFYIELLEKLDKKNKKQYHKFGIENLKHYLDKNYIENHDKIWGFERDNFIKIQEFDKSLVDYVEEQVKHKKDKRLTDINEVITLMKNPIINRGWGVEPELLATLEEETIKTYVLESQEFVDTSFNLIREFGKNSHFKLFIDKLINVFEELKKSDNKDHQIKMERLLGFFEK